ncbi:MAG: DegT/DnrJ/EryC1/StrS family aminotransferase [Alphaproteobacteria bacterium]
MQQVPVFKPLIEEEEINAATEALRMGWLGMGSYVHKFEEGLTSYLGLTDRYLACVNTGHSALHVALTLAGVGPDDEVITPSFNSISDFQAILALGADPVLCDVLDDTLCIDVDKAETLVGPRTKAVLAIDYGCSLADHDKIEAFAARHKLRVIHDAAHAMGSRYHGRMVGSFSDMTMLSFDPVKTLTCLDAGALIVRTEDELRQLHELRLLGMGQPPQVMYQNKRAWTFHVDRVGYRYHLLNLHAAIGLSQLAKMDRISRTRREACRYYTEALADIAELRVPKIDFENVTPFIFYVRLPATMRDDFRAHLGRCGVDTGIHWQPGHTFKFLAGYRKGDLSVTERAGAEVVTLPLHSSMPRGWQEQVVDAIVDYFSRANSRYVHKASANA